MKDQKYNSSPKGPFIVEGKKYISIPELADAYNLNRNGIYQRLSRGKVGDDLIPLKHRKNYEKPEKKVKYKLFVEGKGFKSEAEACRFYGIKFVTYRNRKYKGYSIEECLGIKENSKLGGKRFDSQHYHKSKEITVEGKKYKSRADAARAYGKTEAQVRSLLEKGRTLEESLGIEIADIRHTITFQGIKYKSVKHLCKEKNLSYTTIQSRIKRGMTLEESILQGEYGEYVGRYNLTILKRDNELSSKKAYLYFVRVFLDDDWKYKIGITTRTTQQRLKGTNYKLLFEFSSNLLRCYENEQLLLEKYKNKKDHTKREQYFEGYTEILNLDADDEADIIKFLKNLHK